MNKKVLTLCAGFLLAGGMYANAQYVKVDPANLLDGEYVLANAAGDSIVTFTEGVADSWDNVLVKAATVNEAGDSETVTLTKSGNYWAVTYQGRCIYVHNDNVAYTALGDQTMDIKSLADSLVTFQTNSNKSVTGGTAQARQYLTRTEDALVKGFSKAQTSSQFALYAKLAEAPEGETIANIDEMEQTFLLMIDNQYVGLASETTRAAVADNSGLTLVDEKPANEDGFVWVVEANGAYKNLKSGQYLAVTVDGKLTLSETATANNQVSYNGNGLLIGETLVGAGMILESNTPLPIDYAFTPIEKASDKKVVVWTNEGTVIAADGTLATYNENDAVETVWNVVAVKTGASNYEVRLQNSEAETDGYLAIEDTNGNVQYVTIEGISVDEDGSFSLPTTGGVILRAGNDYVSLQGGKLVTTSVRGQATEFGLGDIKEAFVNVATLLQRNAKSFTIEITYDKDGDQEYETDLTSIFEGELMPVEFVREQYNSGSTWYELAEATATGFMLINEDEKILALNTDPKKVWSSGSTTHAYPLELISAKEYVTDLEKAKTEGRAPYYKTEFSFQYLPGTDAAVVNDITAIYVEGIMLGCYMDNKQVYYLAGEGYDGALDPIKVTLAGTTLVDYKSWLTTPSYYKVEVANNNKKAQFYGKVLGQEEDGAIGFVAPTKTDITKPEGEFAIRYVAATGTTPAYFEFKNRENKETYSFEASKLYEVDMAKHLFAYRDNRYDLMDTLKITPINDYDPSDGFKRFTAADLNANTYNVSMNLVDQSYLYIVENHDDKHRIGLDREEATDWRIEIPTVRLEDITGDLLRYVPDTVTVDVPIHYWVSINGSMKEVSTDMKEDYKGKYYNPKATLKIPTYIFKNTATDEYISGDSDSEEAANSYYYCPSKTSATRMALKIVGDSTLNLIPVYNKYYYWNGDEKGNWFEATEERAVSESYYENYAAGLSLSKQKIIGGTTAVEGKGVLKDVTRFEATSNDLFLIEPSEAPTYKTLAQDNKIIISRVENKDEVIYEDSLFAGIDNRLAYDINPTLYVDTAYVNRPGNYRYEYLLSVRPLRTDSIDDCNNPNHEHPRTAFTEGDFLVVMRDSMDVEDDKNVHNNKYAYNGQPKLAFVSGIHQNDTLYYTNAAGEIIAKSEVGNADYNFAKFAFKMINEDENEFVVETAYGYDAVKWINGEPVEYEVSKGYLKWDNGHLVVTQILDEAERFTMEDSELEATANESITAEGAVSVVATDGAVIIKGAEGKNVVIATILGKVVANETINSDNETIAVPAGIAVVSVDGESFKVVVK